jgi:CheY-like chemotaxis protein
MTTTEPPHVLLVEDEPLAIHTMSRFLGKLGFRVSTAGDGVAALETLEADLARVVVTDLRMPRGGGLDLVAKVRRRWPGLPVIVLTGYGTEEIERQALDAGAHTVLRKPVSIQEVGEMLKGLTAA